nr:protein PAT1 homolog 1-like isoform X2 [Procambarus clarkii]
MATSKFFVVECEEGRETCFFFCLKYSSPLHHPSIVLTQWIIFVVFSIVGIHFLVFEMSEPEDGALEVGLNEDEEYDALNDETFGSAAVDGDWEECHEQMASLTEAGRTKIKQQELHNALRQGDVCLAEEFKHLGLRKYDNPGGRNLTQSSMPINIIGYQSVPASRTHIGSSLLVGPDLPGSPSNSIWTPSPGVDKLRPVIQHSPSNGMGHTLGQIPHGLAQPGISPSLGLPTIKTVAEVEEEMKLQHARSQSSFSLQQALRAEDLERELARQTASKSQQQQQGLSSFLQQSAPFNLQRQGSFTGGMPNNPSQFNRRFQRPFPNQGSYPGSMQQYSHQQHPYQQQQQRFVNCGGFPGNGTKNFSQPPPQLPQTHANQTQDCYSSYHHHHNNYHSNFQQQQQQQQHQQQQQQQQQQSYHHNRNPDGRYINHNGYDQGRNGNGFDRRNYERKPYDQSRSFDQGKNQYDRTGNSREDYSSHPGRIRRDSEAEWEEWHRIREQDEYCGLMTPREKGWLKYIQAMQLHSDSPYQDDYYYVMYSVKQQRKREEEVIEIDGLQLLLPDRGKDGGREYEPPRLENSLGKLQVVSVNAPRKIIDLQVVHLDPSHPTTSLQREMRKHRHLLLYVEKLFNVMMELDDLERKIRHLPDCPTRDLFKSKSRQLASRLWSSVTSTPERLVQLLCIRKGKSLLCRLISWLGESEHEKLVMNILQNMPLLAKKDAHDQHLALFWPITDRLVASSSHDRMIDLAAALNTQGTTPHKTNLASALCNKYGVSLIMALLVRGEHLQSTLGGCDEWQELLLAVINGLATVSDTTLKTSSDGSKASTEIPQALPSVALAASPYRPGQHLARCTKAEPQRLKASQDKMALLEVTHTKPRCQSPVKS